MKGHGHVPAVTCPSSARTPKPGRGSAAAPSAGHYDPVAWFEARMVERRREAEAAGRNVIVLHCLMTHRVVWAERYLGAGVWQVEPLLPPALSVRQIH